MSHGCRKALQMWMCMAQRSYKLCCRGLGVHCSPMATLWEICYCQASLFSASLVSYNQFLLDFSWGLGSHWAPGVRKCNMFFASCLGRRERWMTRDLPQRFKPAPPLAPRETPSPVDGLSSHTHSPRFCTRFLVLDLSLEKAVIDRQLMFSHPIW